MLQKNLLKLIYKMNYLKQIELIVQIRKFKLLRNKLIIRKLIQKCLNMVKIIENNLSKNLKINKKIKTIMFIVTQLKIKNKRRINNL